MTNTLTKIFTSGKQFFFGKKEKVTEKLFYFELIEYYYKSRKDKQSGHRISDRTMNDIDFYEVFQYVDETKSKIGQQYLFDRLLTIPGENDFEQQEEWIDYLQHNSNDRVVIEDILSGLDKRESFYISNLFLDEYIQKPAYFWLLKILATLPVIFLLLTFISKLFLPFIVFAVILNLIFHYVNKQHIYLYKDSIPQLLVLIRCVKDIISMKLPVEPEVPVVSSLKSIESLKNKLLIFNIENKSDSEMSGFLFALVEYFKIIFLLEPLLVFNVLEKLDSKRKDIQQLYEYIGRIDSYSSILSLRQKSPGYCIPLIGATQQVLDFKEIYHPLVLNCVANTLTVKDKSILLTGSNMAGKTTFIRTIALNVLLAQTIHTCFAKEFTCFPIRLFSSIRISDDLFSDKSYYFEEVLSLKSMINESSGKEYNLFLLDEIFKGTNTIERIASGKAVLSYLAESSQNIVFVSTHDVELAELLKDKYELYHFTEVVENEQIHFDYKLKKGELSTRNAIRILEINGYPPEIIEEAKALSNTLQQKKR